MITKITCRYSFEVLDFNCNDFGFTFNIGVSHLGIFYKTSMIFSPTVCSLRTNFCMACGNELVIRMIGKRRKEVKGAILTEFSTKLWNELPPSEKKKHSLLNCDGYMKNDKYKALLIAFPVNKQARSHCSATNKRQNKRNI